MSIEYEHANWVQLGRDTHLNHFIFFLKKSNNMSFSLVGASRARPVARGPWPVARGGNSLLQAVQRGSAGAVRHLVRTVPGAAAARDGFFGSTALHTAVAFGHAEICRVLLAAGAPLDARDNSGLLAEDCGAGDVSVEKHWQFLPIPSASAPFKVF